MFGGSVWKGKYLPLKYLLISKTQGIVIIWSFKELIFGGPGGRWHPQSMSKYVSVKYLLISKKLAPYFEPSKKVILGVHFGGIPEGWHPQTMS